MDMGGLIQNIKLSGADTPKVSALREKGLECFVRQGLPTAKTEAWKYTRVRELMGQDFVIEGSEEPNQRCKGDEASKNRDCSCHMQTLPFVAYEIHFCNGKLKENHFHLPDGIEIIPLYEAFYNPEMFRMLNKSFEMENFPFAALNTAYLEQGVFIRIARNIKLDKPLALVYHVLGGIKRFANIHNVISVETGAKATIVEYYHYSGEAKSAYFNNIVNEIHVGRQAIVRHYAMQNEAFKAVHIALNAVKVKKDGNYKSFCLQKGANLARRETHVMLQEIGASSEVNAVYIMNGWATLDTTTDIEHLVANTHSTQLVKGVVGGQAKGVFQGKIHIAPNAQQTEGRQLHKALLLSNEAEVDVKPELEIFADDVKCSHGATCGELDEEQLFYLRSRGISEEEARRILIEAFVNEAYALIEDENIRLWLQSF